MQRYNNICKPALIINPQNVKERLVCFTFVLIPFLWRGQRRLLFHWSYHGFYESYLFFREAVFLVKHLVSPRMREVLEGDKLIYSSCCILGIFYKRNHKSKEFGFNIACEILSISSFLITTNYNISFCAGTIWFCNYRFP